MAKWQGETAYGKYLLWPKELPMTGNQFEIYQKACKQMGI